MTRQPGGHDMKKVLGTAIYRAVRSPFTGQIELTAQGILPCANYRAELEKRPDKTLPPIWNLVFHIEPVCLRMVLPFKLKAYMAGDTASTVQVYDARGTHEVPVVDPIVMPLDDLFKAADQFEVYARLPAPPDHHHGCIIVPEGSLVPAIYYHAFGPASEAECQAWMAENCNRFDLAKSPDVPWPDARE